MAAFEAVGRGSIPRWGTACPWSVVDARDFAEVVDQVRLLAGTESFRRYREFFAVFRRRQARRQT